MVQLKPFYWNFDGLDVAFQGAISAAMVKALETAKTNAQASRSPVLFDWNGERMHVAESGARGGYAYRCDTGPTGATWFFGRDQSKANWNIRVSVKSNALACVGLGRVRMELYRFLSAIGAEVNAESLSRVDYCMDFLDADISAATGKHFALDPYAFVMHSHTNREEHQLLGELQSNGNSGRHTSVTCGKMPGRQLIIYDKSREIVAHRKVEWWEHWGAARSANNLPPLLGTERVWRIEIRAGKRYLKNIWGITSWAALHDRFGDLLLDATSKVRYTIPNQGDRERFRWPMHPLWEAVRESLKTDLAEMTCGAGAEVVKFVQQSELRRIVEAQLTGLLPTFVLSSNLPNDVSAISAAVERLTRNYLQKNSERFARGLRRSAEKYQLIVSDGSA